MRITPTCTIATDIVERKQPMSRREHWDTVYETNPPDTVSWFSPHLKTSLALIERAAPDRDAAIIDVGGGTSTLVDDLIARGYSDLSVLDISASALEVAKRRLGEASAKVDWRVADLLEIEFAPKRYRLWHDRAVFHFFTEEHQRQHYAEQLCYALEPDGHAIIATFGPAGPQRCSGLETAHYDASELSQLFSPRLLLVDSLLESHPTPFGTEQQFLYTLFRRI
jgi:SAM-dependent methyltransferase